MPTEVAAAALVIVGTMMFSQLRHVNVSEFSVALPVVLTPMPDGVVPPMTSNSGFVPIRPPLARTNASASAAVGGACFAAGWAC